MSLLSFIINIAEECLLNPQKYLVSGHNGPYYDDEKIVRVYGAWIIIFSKCFEWTNDLKYKERVKELSEIFLNEKYKPFGFTYWHRNNENKDRCNGLIGQAWTIEALVSASKCLGMKKYMEEAEKLFLLHSFKYKAGLWDICEIDGSNNGPDPTFNHQLWFASCASMITGEKKSFINNQIRIFMNNVDKNMTIFSNGLIYHPIEHLINKRILKNYTLISTIKRIIKKYLLFKTLSRIENKKKYLKDVRKKLIYKSIGYQSFNTYAFSILKENYPEHPIWKKEYIKTMIEYLKSIEYKNAISENKYGFSYNPPGFEIPYSISILGKNTNVEYSVYENWISQQILNTYNCKELMFSNNTTDKITLTSRIYELTRMNKNILEKIEVKDCLFQ